MTHYATRLVVAVVLGFAGVLVLYRWVGESIDRALYDAWR